MPLKKRENKHQTHFEDLVILGELDELDDKIEGMLEDITGKASRLNITTKIDGSPAVFIWHQFPGLPDNSVGLKSFLGKNPAEGAMSTPEDVDRKYPLAEGDDRNTMLKYCLELAPNIPAGEAWQGDCLFVRESKREENINGIDYITFKPNTLVYAFSEKNPGYENVKNADFGICFHTIYKSTGEGRSQTFNVDVSRINAPSNFYLLSPALKYDKSSFNLQSIYSWINKLNNLEAQLVANPDYEALISNEAFMDYWNTFENSQFRDERVSQIDEKTFINKLKDFIRTRRTNRLNSYLKGKTNQKTIDTNTQKAESEITELQELVDANSRLLSLIVTTLNVAVKIKMLLWDGFKKSSQDYDTFYSDEGSYTPGTMEGVSVSDQDGNIVKIVDRSEFSHHNAQKEGLEESLYQKFTRLLMESLNPKTAVVAFGSFNPPTLGHLKLARTIAEIAKQEKGDGKIYLSHKYTPSSDPKLADPLHYQDKLYFARKAFEPLGVEVPESPAPNPYKMLAELYKQGYQRVIFVGGSDRIGGEEDYTASISAYNGKQTKRPDDYYKFDLEFRKVDRDKKSSDPATRASATLVRTYAKENDFDHFAELLPFEGDDLEDLFDMIREGMGLGDLNEELLTEDPIGTKSLKKKEYLNIKDNVANTLRKYGLQAPDPDKGLDAYKSSPETYQGLFVKQNSDKAVSFSEKDLYNYAINNGDVPDDVVSILDNLIITDSEGNQYCIHRSGDALSKKGGKGAFATTTTTYYQEAIYSLLLGNKLPEAYSETFKEWLLSSSPQENTNIFKYILPIEANDLSVFTDKWQGFINDWYPAFITIIKGRDAFVAKANQILGSDVDTAEIIHSGIKNKYQAIGAQLLSGKDTFDKSDVYFGIGNLDNILSEMMHLGHGKDKNVKKYVEFMLDNSKNIIGVSLKRPTGELKANWDIPAKELNYFKDEVIWTGSKKTGLTQVIQFETEDGVVQFNLRSNKIGENGTMEWKGKNASSQLGKAVSAFDAVMQDKPDVAASIKGPLHKSVRDFKLAAKNFMTAITGKEDIEQDTKYTMTDTGKNLVTQIFNLSCGFAAIDPYDSVRITAPYLKVY